MPRYKQPILKPWLSGKLDNRDKRFIQVGASLLQSTAFKSLNYASRILYLCLANDAGKENSVEFSHSAAKRYGFPPSTFDRSIKELIAAGFIERVEDEDRSQYKTSRFRFTYKWKTSGLRLSF